MAVKNKRVIRILTGKRQVAVEIVKMTDGNQSGFVTVARYPHVTKVQKANAVRSAQRKAARLKEVTGYSIME